MKEGTEILVFCVLLWIFAIILIITNPQNKSIRLSGLMAFFTGCGGLADNIFYRLIPSLAESASQRLVVIAKYTAGIFNAMAYYGGPYFLLIFSICYSEIFNIKIKILVYMLLLVPIILMSTRTSIYPSFQTSCLELLTWAAPYFLATMFFLTYTMFIAKDQKTKRSRSLVFLLIAPNAMALFLVNYLGPTVGVLGYSLSGLNDIIGMVTLFEFIILAAKYGILGVKIEAFNIEQQMKTATLDTNLINHSIKNEVAKIKLCVNNLTSFIMPNQITKDNMSIIDESFNNITSMISRIQQKTGTIVLKEEPCCLSDLIELALRTNGPLSQNRDIKIIKKFEPGIFFLCDKVHFHEVLSNILKNAIEAIPVSETGWIKVEAKVTKQQLILEFHDNGSGIAKDVLPYIFEPFFSTKHKSTNFGLGLSYCLNVLQKSGGLLEAFSEENIGTTIAVKLPVSKILRNYSSSS